ncbi:MAG: hypothetical protein HOI95_29470 [Chromatiales bacterium]|nr:hypothetical protein [Chromatiales bacterium]
MRTSEATGLTRADVDFQGSVLLIRQAKFGKPLWVPMHPTTVHALQCYVQARDHDPRLAQSDAFFPMLSSLVITVARHKRKMLSTPFVSCGACFGGLPAAVIAPHVFTIFDTPSYAVPCSAGTRTAPTSTATSWRSRPTSGTPRSPIRTGTSLPPRG